MNKQTGAPRACKEKKTKKIHKKPRKKFNKEEISARSKGKGINCKGTETIKKTNSIKDIC